MNKRMKRLLKGQMGQTATEYMLIVGVIVVGLIMAAHAFVPKFGEVVTKVGDRVLECVTSGDCQWG